MESQVWVVNNAGHDFTNAEKYGDLMQYLTHGRVNVFNPQKLAHEFKAKMATYNENDWLLLSGGTVLNCVATAVVMAKFGKVKMLIFDAIKRDYVPQTLTFGDVD